MEAAMSMGFTVAGFVDPNATGDHVWGLPLFERTDQDLVAKHHLALGIGDNHQRARVFTTIRQEFPKSSFPAVIHKSAVVASSASIGEGTVVLALGYVGAGTRAGRGVIVNSLASLDHESEMKDFSSLAPGARTGGNVTIGRHTTIGMNSAVLQGLSVGDDAVIGAMSLVRTDIDESTVAYGIPARVIRQRLAE
jgi:sugar O-acyltransferase (sialic acid O-acetyltransferase NeuD family)